MSYSSGKDENFKRLLSLLLAEDDDSLRETLSLFFAAQGFQVYQAGTGKEAVDIALERQIAFSVMDVNLPVLSGIDAFRFIVRQKGRIPCIFMSGDTSLENMEQALNAGAFTFIPKPIRMDLMQESVDRLVAKYFQSKRRGKGFSDRGS